MDERTRKYRDEAPNALDRICEALDENMGFTRGTVTAQQVAKGAIDAIELLGKILKAADLAKERE